MPSYLRCCGTGRRRANPGGRPPRPPKLPRCKIGICYCVNDELKATIAAKVDAFRQTIAEQRKAGKAIGYLSVPLTSAGGGNFDVNEEVAERARAAIEKRFGADYIFVLNPGTKEGDLPRSSTGADYMLMWTSLLEGADGLGEFDFAYFAGPQDFARYFGFDGSNGVTGKLDAYFDKRVAADPGFAKAVQGGLSKATFRKYYALRASTTRQPRRARQMEHLPHTQRKTASSTTNTAPEVRSPCFSTAWRLRRRRAKPPCLTAMSASASLSRHRAH